MAKRSDLLKPGKTRFMKKGWGYEYWLCNNELYCGKMLFLNEGKRCSWHYHKKKDETFYVDSGLVLVTYGFADHQVRYKNKTLYPGDVFHVPPGTRHQLIGLRESRVFEFSTTHREADSIRVIKGD